MKLNALKQFIDQRWDESIVPTLCEYIRIPCKSPLFDPQWQTHGHMDRAVTLLHDWARAQPIPGMQVDVVRLPGRTPVLFIEIPGQGPGQVLLYGHLDKQPEFTGWRKGLDPWTPVIENGRLYGRGGADDGYALFSSLTAVRALAERGIPHARCIVLIEACEESGSDDLPFYIDALQARIGRPELVVCLDAECGNYDQWWITTSLRGNLVGTLSVEVLTEGVHSGGASGIVPSSFSVLRTLLDRLEDSANGRILPKTLHGTIPVERVAQARAAAQTLGDTVFTRYPWAGETRARTKDPGKALLANTWGPTLCVTGAAGLPELGQAGNVLRPQTAVKLSFRLPPTCDAGRAGQKIKKLLEENPPARARVRFDVESTMDGWDAPGVAPWLAQSVQQASQMHFGAAAMYMGTGGSIPFMGMLAERFPAVQFLVTGVLGPHSNAHGPNEFLDIATGKRVTACVAQVLADHCQR